MNKTVNGISFWEQTKGPRAQERILRYQCVKGDSAFIATGKKPKCPECKGGKLKPVCEIEQLGLFSSKFNLVMCCKNPECGVHIVYDYEISYDIQESE